MLHLLLCGQLLFGARGGCCSRVIDEEIPSPSLHIARASRVLPCCAHRFVMVV